MINNNRDIPVIEPASGGYWEIYPDRRIWCEDRLPQENMKIVLESKYLKAGENIKDGDIITLLDEGKYQPGKFGKKLEFNVKLANSEEKVYSPNVMTQKNLMSEWGEDSKAWIGQEIKVWIIRQVVQGVMKSVIYCTPTDWTEPVKGAEVAEEEEINPEDIPRYSDILMGRPRAL